ARERRGDLLCGVPAWRHGPGMADRRAEGERRGQLGSGGLREGQLRDHPLWRRRGRGVRLVTTPHVGRSLVTGAAALALVMGAAAPVHARPGALEFSQDGVLWSAAPPNALFEEQIVLVPGDSASTTLHLRNIAGSTGVLRLGLDSAEVAGEDAAEAFGITVVLTSRNAETDVPERRAVGGLEPGLAPAGEARIAPREAVAITVIVDLDAAVTGQVAQSSVLHLGLTLHLAEAT